MKASILDLRRRMAEVLRALDRNETVKIFYRGRERAVLIPSGMSQGVTPPAKSHPAFGIWKDRDDLDDVPAYVRSLRRGRFDAA
jgi:antitoxin (DNA-binding transcriptional repressor) of toxin-antitoxin stability system